MSLIRIIVVSMKYFIYFLLLKHNCLVLKNTLQLSLIIAYKENISYWDKVVALEIRIQSKKLNFKVFSNFKKWWL